MTFIVLDLELNQPSRSIIQIGAVKLDLKQGTIEPFFNKVVNPGEDLDPFISNMTGIDKAELSSADSLKSGLKSFWDSFQSADVDNRLAVWGEDVEWIQTASETRDLEVPEVRKYDLQKMFRFVHASHDNSFERGVGLVNTVDMYGLEFDGDHHDALDDATMTASLMLCFFEDLCSLYHFDN